MDYGPGWAAEVERARHRREAAFAAATRRRGRWRTARAIAWDVAFRTVVLTVGTLALAHVAGWTG